MSNLRINKNIWQPTPKDGYYSKLVQNIYKDNKLVKDRIKNTYSRNEDPIAGNVKSIKDDIQPLKRKTINKNLTSEQLESRNGKGMSKMTKSVDYFQSSYSIFYNAGENKSNFTNNKNKTTKKLFTKEKQACNVTDDDSGKNRSYSRKLYPNQLYKKTLTNLIKELDGNSNQETKDNTKDTSTSKKHFNAVSPSREVLRFNDKQKLLPVEYCEKYKRPYSRISSLSISNNKESFYDDSNNIKPVKKVKYPYAKDNLKDVLMNYPKPRKEDKIATKINKNPFDILNKVKRFDWEIQS